MFGKATLSSVLNDRLCVHKRDRSGGLGLSCEVKKVFLITISDARRMKTSGQSLHLQSARCSRLRFGEALQAKGICESPEKEQR